MRMLMSNYQEALYYHIRRMVGNHEDADDVLQNTLVKTYQGLKNFRGESKLYSWLYRIASNECLTLIEKRKKHRTISIEDATEPMAPSHDGMGPEEIQEALGMAIAQLPPKQQLVFNLKYYEELKYEEIAEITGTSIGALKSSFHIAVKKIEAVLVSRSNLLNRSKS